jgi:O-antigen/teichoic acid export membrane protein
MANLFLLAKAFGPVAYGTLAGLVALYVTFSQFIGLGTGVVLVREGARSSESLERWLQASRRIYFYTGLAGCVIGPLIALALLSDRLEPAVAWAIGVAELFFGCQMLPAIYRAQAEQRMHLFGFLSCAMPAVRLISVMTVYFIGVPSLYAYALVYLSASVVSALAIRLRLAGRSEIRNPIPMGSAARQGGPFVLSNLTSAVTTELDKTMLLRLATPEQTGQYTAAFRITQIVSIPMSSLIVSATARLFRRDSSSRLLAQTGPYFFFALCYGLAAALCVYLAMPWILTLLGTGFRIENNVRFLLCAYVLTSSVRQLVVALLTTSDLQIARNWIEVCAIFLSFLMNLVLIPGHGASGAALTLVATDVLIVGAGLRALGGGAANRRIQ